MRREVVGSGRAVPAELVAAADLHDVGLVREAVEHRRAPREEGRVDDDVVFEDDRLVDVVEDPVQPALDPGITAQVLGREVSRDVAGPVDAADHGGSPEMACRMAEDGQLGPELLRAGLFAAPKGVVLADVADFEAWGLEYRAQLRTDDPAFNIHVSALSVVVEELL